MCTPGYSDTLYSRRSLLPRHSDSDARAWSSLNQTRNFWAAHAVDGYRARVERRAWLAGARSLGLHALARDRPPYVEVVPDAFKSGGRTS
jgi:hypothetical protein